MYGCDQPTEPPTVEDLEDARWCEEMMQRLHPQKTQDSPEEVPF